MMILFASLIQESILENKTGEKGGDGHNVGEENN